MFLDQTESILCVMGWTIAPERAQLTKQEFECYPHIKELYSNYRVFWDRKRCPGWEPTVIPSENRAEFEVKKVGWEPKKNIMLSTLKSKKKPRSKKYPHETETFFFSIFFFQKGRFRKVLLFIHSRLFSVVWSSEDSLQKSVLCFCLGGSGNQTPVVQPDLATFTNEKSCPAL